MKKVDESAGGRGGGGGGGPAGAGPGRPFAPLGGGNNPVGGVHLLFGGAPGLRATNRGFFLAVWLRRKSCSGPQVVRIFTIF